MIFFIIPYSIMFLLSTFYSLNFRVNSYHSLARTCASLELHALIRLLNQTIILFYSTICLIFIIIHMVEKNRKKTHSHTSTFHFKLMPRTWILRDDYISQVHLLLNLLGSVVHKIWSIVSWKSPWHLQRVCKIKIIFIIMFTCYSPVSLCWYYLQKHTTYRG